MDAAQNKFFYRALFAGGLGLQFAIERIWNVYRGSHRLILPYLWLRIASQKWEEESPRRKADSRAGTRLPS